jgi:VWFA-related protein
MVYRYREVTTVPRGATIACGCCPFGRHRTGLATITRVAFLGFCLLVPGTVIASPQRQNPPPLDSTLRVTTTVVNVYAIIRDNKGRLVPYLNKSDFKLTEENVPQQIGYFSRETSTPLRLGLVFDTSPSQERVLATEQREAREFVRQVLGTKDQAFLTRFDLDVELLQDFTNNQQLLARTIDETRINYAERPLLAEPSPSASVGGSHLYDAVYLASNELMKSEVGRKVLVLVTDGEDQGSKINAATALVAAEKADVIIYCVAVSDPEFYQERGMGFKGDSALRKISERTGGRLIRVNGTHNTAAAFREIATELRTEYFLGYSPLNLRHDGSFRGIRVRITSGKYKIQARRGYYSPKE